MSKEKSAGAVIFRKQEGKTYYLLLRYQVGHWGCPKGHIEKGERLEDTAQRETKEESGIEDIKMIQGFKEQIKYFFKGDKGMIFKEVTFFLFETKQKKIKLSLEHIDYKWLVFKDALEQITFKKTKDVLRKANSFLEKLSP